MVRLKRKVVKVLAVAASAYCLMGRIRGVIDGTSPEAQDGEWEQTRETEELSKDGRMVVNLAS